MEFKRRHHMHALLQQDAHRLLDGWTKAEKLGVPAQPVIARRHMRGGQFVFSQVVDDSLQFLTLLSVR